MPSLSLPTEYTLLSRAILIAALSTSLLLSGCGSENQTTRTSDSSSNSGGSSDSKNTYDVSVYSPISLTNVRFRIVDAASNTEIGSQIVAAGRSATFAVPRTYATYNAILVAEVLPLNSTSTYYDVALDQHVPFTETLHSALSMTNSTRTLKIDFFSEVAYQRALVRAGNIDPTKAVISSLTRQDLTDSSQEIVSVLRVRPNEHGLIYDTRSDLAKLAIGSANVARFSDVIFGVGHIMLYHNTHPTDAAPALGLMRQLVKDLRDGDLDGLTLVGLGDRDQIYLNDPLVTPIINSDANRNTSAALAEDQRPARQAYNVPYGNVMKTFFNTQYLFGTPEYQLINTTNYEDGIALPLFGIHSVGAGNYTRAFGLKTGETQQNFVNADDTRLISATEQLIGHYTGSGCSLDIYPSGRILLTQGNNIFESTINREMGDTISRADANTDHYLLNVVTPSDSLPSFIQLRTIGSTVVSATAGRSAELNPDVLQKIDATCTF
jgi:hypothetical protein